MMVMEGYKRETTNDRMGAVRGSLPQIVGDSRKGLILWVISAQLDCEFAAPVGWGSRSSRAPRSLVGMIASAVMSRIGIIVLSSSGFEMQSFKYRYELLPIFCQ